MNSIRSKLLYALLGALLAALLLGAWATYQAEVRQAELLLDYHLRQTALALRDQSFDSAAPPQLQSDDADLDYSIQVWNQDGVTVYYSYPQHVFPNRAQLGYTTVQTGQGPWRVYAMQSRTEVIEVAQPMSRRGQLAAHAAWQSLRPYLLLFPVMAVLIWLIVGQGLRPIARLAAAIKARSPAAMEPVSERVPDEVQPLVRALNDLLARLQSALQLQRQFVADAAHELRTPLAALTLQAQLVERAGDEQQRRAALAELQQGLQRSARVVQQLLTLAREEPGSVQPVLQPVALPELLPTLAGEYRALAQAHQIQLEIDPPVTALSVLANRDALHTLLANVLDNALRYTPSGGRVLLSAHSVTDGVLVRVDDSGPGIPPSERARVFDRFYRRDGVEQPGTGLGLAIVKAIAERYGWSVTLQTSRDGGLCVELRLPRALSPP